MRPKIPFTSSAFPWVELDRELLDRESLSYGRSGFRRVLPRAPSLQYCTPKIAVFRKDSPQARHRHFYPRGARNLRRAPQGFERPSAVRSPAWSGVGDPGFGRTAFVRVDSCLSVVDPSRSGSDTPLDSGASHPERRFNRGRPRGTLGRSGSRSWAATRVHNAGTRGARGRAGPSCGVGSPGSARSAPAAAPRRARDR